MRRKNRYPVTNAEPLPLRAPVPCRDLEGDGDAPDGRYTVVRRFRGLVGLLTVYQEQDGAAYDPRDCDNVGAISWRGGPRRRGGDDERPDRRAVWSFADIVAACEREELRAAVRKAGADPEDAEAVGKIADAAGLDAENFGAEPFAGLVLPFYPHGTYSSDDDYTGGHVYRMPEDAGGLLETLDKERGAPCGVLYADAETIRSEYEGHTDAATAYARASEVLQGELETYSAWCRGDVYDYTVEVGTSRAASGKLSAQERAGLEVADDEAQGGGYIEPKPYPYRESYVGAEGLRVLRRCLAAEYVRRIKEDAEAFAWACRD